MTPDWLPADYTWTLDAVRAHLDYLRQEINTHQTQNLRILVGAEMYQFLQLQSALECDHVLGVVG